MDADVLTALDLAYRWKMSPGTLANWRAFKKGPPYVKSGRLVRYKVEDIKKFESENRITPMGIEPVAPPRKPPKKARRKSRRSPGSRRARRRNGS